MGVLQRAALLWRKLRLPIAGRTEIAVRRGPRDRVSPDIRSTRSVAEDDTPGVPERTAQPQPEIRGLEPLRGSAGRAACGTDAGGRLGAILGAGLAGALIAEVSRDLRYRSVSQPYAEFLGKPIERILGESMQTVIGEEAFQVMRPYIERVLAGERVEFQTAVPYGSAGTRHLHVLYIPGFDVGGSVSSWIARLREVRKPGGRDVSPAHSCAWHLRYT